LLLLYYYDYYNYYYQIADSELWKHRLSKTIDFLKDEVYSSSSSSSSSNNYNNSSNCQQVPDTSGQKISTAIIGLMHILN